MVYNCVICGRPVPNGRYKYCSDRCANEAENARQRTASEGRERLGIYRQRVCQDCGITYVGHIKTKRCPDCQAAANRAASRRYRERKKAGKERAIGSISLCEACGKPYTVDGPLQRYCKECAPHAVRENVRRIHRTYNQNAYYNPDNPEGSERIHAMKKRKQRIIVCPVCGKNFAPKGRQKWCSPECMKEGKKAYYAAYDEERKEKKQAKAKARWATLTKEERDEVNRKAREYYAARQAKKRAEADKQD